MRAEVWRVCGVKALVGRGCVTTAFFGWNLQRLEEKAPVVATMSAATDSMPASDASGGDSMAARLARQRQQRSKLRTSNVPLEEAAENTTPSSARGELQILRQEVANSGATISRLQTRLQESEAEMAELGSSTARMAEELRQMRARADAHQASGGPAVPPIDVADAADAAEDDGPMEVSICMDDMLANPMEGISVRISLATDRSGKVVSTAMVNDGTAAVQ